MQIFQAYLSFLAVLVRVARVTNYTSLRKFEMLIRIHVRNKRNDLVYMEPNNKITLCLRFFTSKKIGELISFFLEKIKSKYYFLEKYGKLFRCWLLFIARVAQLVERWTFNPTVQGSSPCSGVYFYVFLLATYGI
jgi:hypothetical protein